MIYKLEHLSGKMNYMEARSKLGNNPMEKVHLGQIKLLLTETFFIAKMMEKNPTKVVYIGAGSDGYHNNYLVRLFPTLKYDFWDPGKFNIAAKPNITIFNKFFRDQDADKYAQEVKKGERILFMSDIRNLEIRNYKDIEMVEKADDVIRVDMNNQLRWVKTIKPIAAYLKFRMPYTQESYTYFDGPVYMQPFFPLSTEARILVTDYEKMTEYHGIDHDEKFAYFNANERSKPNDRWKEVLEKNNVVNIWDTNYALCILLYYLRKMKKPASDNDVIKLFLDIIEFHAKLNRKKYSVLFTNNPSNDHDSEFIMKRESNIYMDTSDDK